MKERKNRLSRSLFCKILVYWTVKKIFAVKRHQLTQISDLARRNNQNVHIIFGRRPRRKTCRDPSL